MGYFNSTSGKLFVTASPQVVTLVIAVVTIIVVMLLSKGRDPTFSVLHYYYYYYHIHKHLISHELLGLRKQSAFAKRAGA
jgi:hypothetical protein